MVPSLAVLNQYLFAKKEFLACSRTIKQVRLPLWEAAFLMFESNVLVGISKLISRCAPRTQDL